MEATDTEDLSQATQFPLPRILTHPASAPPRLITQGAEGRLYQTTFLLPSIPCALKYRPSKPYRHPILDARLTRHRILSEARILVKCRREGVVVPAVYAVDETAGWLIIEWIEGAPVRVGINEFLGRRKGVQKQKKKEEEVRSEAEGKDAAAEGQVRKASQGNEELIDLMRRVGVAVGKLHKSGVVHGDLTTSNMMLRPWKHGTATAGGNKQGYGSLEGEIVLIDFGLASQSVQEEDRAVDLYVLERAFGSTHPRAEPLFSELLEGYKSTFKQAATVLKKLEDVRMRGRKRSMLG